MRVSLLIELLQRFPKDAEVFVNGTEIAGAEMVSGRVRDGYYGKSLKVLPQGKDEAVVLTATTEISTGEIVQTRVIVP